MKLKGKNGWGGSPLIDCKPGDYLLRKKSRQASDNLSRHILLGLLISMLLIIFGSYKYYFEILANDNLWKNIILLGWTSAVITIIVPSIWIIPERLLKFLGNIIGKLLFELILIFVYFILIWPVGIYLKNIRGTSPIYHWKNNPPKNMEGWRSINNNENSIRKQRNYRSKTSLIDVIYFFIERGNLIFIPVIFILVSLGILLFFIQQSAFAPFIYTLF